MNQDLLSGLTGGTVELPRGNGNGILTEGNGISTAQIQDSAVTTAKEVPAATVEVLGSDPVVADLSKWPTLAAIEKAYVYQVLGATNGNKTKAAAVLGVTIKTVYNRLDQYAAEAKKTETN